MHEHASRPPAARLPRVVARSKVWLEVDGQFAVGQGAIALLDTLAKRGSLRQAAAAIRWSYRHTWDYLRQAETALGVPLIATTPEHPRSGAVLTEAGQHLLDTLHAIDEAVRRECDRVFRGGATGTAGRRSRPPKSRGGPGALVRQGKMALPQNIRSR